MRKQDQNVCYYLQIKANKFMLQIVHGSRESDRNVIENRRKYTLERIYYIVSDFTKHNLI